jgi:hypothetical protein
MATLRISGRVIDRNTQSGIAGLRVEVWDKDLIVDDLVGNAITDAQGQFVMEFDPSDFQDLFPERHPDLFFKIFRDRKLLCSTEDSVLWNVKSQNTEVAIAIELPENEKGEKPVVRHGTVSLRNGYVPCSPFHEGGRFGRIFPNLPPHEPSDQFLIDLGEKGGPMDEGAGSPASDSTTIPAGFTFLGQFIDHDITLDTTSSLERQNDPTAIRNFRTPLLELDNVYGLGPEASPYLYDQENPGKLLVGTAENPHDLPRNRQNTALIGDPRNDENLIISQLHLAFLKFHNKAVDCLLDEKVSEEEVFEEAQRLVRWHYQWIIVHEYLPLTVGREVVDDILYNGRQYYFWKTEPFIPVEFSVAAFRLGHSQVRNRFRVNDNLEAELFKLSFFDAVSPDMVVDWSHFFQINPYKSPQFSKKLDSKIATILLDLPVPIVPGSESPERRSLAVRNLLRGKSFSLPSGQTVARAMCVKPLSQEELGFAGEAPLWFYILKEAQVQTNGETLGKVGGRLVAEVLLGLLQGDFLSYLRLDPCWQPSLPSAKPGEFTMADLLTFANS